MFQYIFYVTLLNSFTLQNFTYFETIYVFEFNSNLSKILIISKLYLNIINFLSLIYIIKYE